jgi:peptidoglycan/xylan/chitin deacetylase (PgdA/CDA1 family)
MKAIMYHYVRPDATEPPHYYYLDLDDFRRQLDHFEREYGFVSREAFLAACRGSGDGPDASESDGVVLTFDDGLVDHHEWVLPELESRGLWGAFYVPTGPLVGNGILDVHRIHTLLGAYGGQRVLDELQPRVTEEMIPEGRVEEFRDETYTRQDNAESTELVKRILNYYVTDAAQSALIDDLVAELPRADVDVTDLYMTGDQLAALQDAGMVVGSHSISHGVFSNMPADRQRREIFDSFDTLSDLVCGLDVRTFCYPYGGFHTFTDETRRLLREAECEFAFNVESRDIEPDDFRESPQALPRYDCNEHPHGDASGSLG